MGKSTQAKRAESHPEDSARLLRTAPRKTCPPAKTSEAFRKLAAATASKLGSHWAFIAAVALIVGWAASGPLFKFSATWQLFINTGTTIITFLMVFLIQSTQNRDAKAIHLKLDELIRSSKARNVFAALEDASEEELDDFQSEFVNLRKQGHDAPEAAVKAHERVHRDHVSSAELPAQPKRSSSERRS